MRYMKVFDRYSQRPADSSIGRGWQSTRRGACGCYLTGIVIETRPGAVRIRWAPNWNRPDSWEPTELGTLMRT